VRAIARGALGRSRRFASLEPMHLLRVGLELAAARELGTLVEAEIERPRHGLTSTLAAMEAAGRALRWARAAAPARIAEPELWGEVNALLDALDQLAPRDPVAAQPLVAAAGLRMLAACGWGLELASCVRCGRPCPERARAQIDLAEGGVVCRSCGGGTLALSARQRLALLQALEGASDALAAADPAAAVELVEQAFAAHG
jgi:DNA repair protein RecO (recombination protein O)